LANFFYQKNGSVTITTESLS